MQSNRDSSLWRSLAVAFGDGLAFGVGMKLTQAAGRQAASARPGLTGDTPEPVRIDSRAPARADVVDQKVFDAILSALEARLNEHSGNVGRHLAELEARLALELRSLEQQDQTVARQVAEDIETMQHQMIGLHREFGEAVARIVAEQVASEVEARAAALRREMQESLAGMIAAQVAAQVKAEVSTQVAARSALLQHTIQAQMPAAAEMAIQSRLPAEVQARLEPIERRHREEQDRKNQEIAGLRQRLADTDAGVLDLVTGIGQICRLAAERISPSGDKTPPQPAGTIDAPAPAEAAPQPAEPGVAEEAATDTPAPGFTQPPKPGGLWRVPLVSSFLLGTAAMAFRHYL